MHSLNLSAIMLNYKQMKKKIRPVSDLRNSFAEISREIHEDNEPIFLTKNGYGDMVVLSMEAYENLQLESEIYTKLKEAEKNNKTYSSKEVLKELKNKYNV